MKRNFFKELKGKPVADLGKELRDKKEALRQLRFDLAAGKIKNAALIREAKKDIARIMTLLNSAATSNI